MHVQNKKNMGIVHIYHYNKMGEVNKNLATCNIVLTLKRVFLSTTTCVILSTAFIIMQAYHVYFIMVL